MKITKIVLSLLTLSAFLMSCTEVSYTEITCRDFSFTEEDYWFTENVDDTVTFVNEDTQDTVNYIVIDKSIIHTLSYLDNTGCSCYDISGMLLKSGSDSLWLQTFNYYVYNYESTIYEEVVFANANYQSLIYDDYMTYIDTLTIDSITYDSVKYFNYDFSDNELISKVYLVKNLGIIQFSNVAGETWKNIKREPTDTNTIEDFSYTETE